MEWSNEKIQLFIELYEEEPAIWNPKDLGHKARTPQIMETLARGSHLGAPTAAFPRRASVARRPPVCTAARFSTMQFEYDPERLIEEVKKRPGIWDFDNVEYRTKNTRHKLWNEVVNELLQTNVKVSKSEMRELELQLQKKWKSIRDCFQKYIANPSRTRRPYLYCKQLQFLLKDQDLPAETVGTSDSDDGPKFTKIKKRKIWKQKVERRPKVVATTDEDDNFDEDDNRSNNFEDDDAIEVPITKVAKIKPPEEFVFANVDLAPVKDGEDPDKLFFLSLLPHFKAIPEEFRLNVKMELMQVLQNAHYNTVREHKLI